jgi:hypothetical protein
MAVRNEILPTFAKRLATQHRAPEREPHAEADHHLEIAVVFTSVENTLAALRKAAAVASGLGARITLVVPQIVPYPLPLTSPPVLLDFNERRFAVIARESTVETNVHVYLCRDRQEALVQVLAPHSLVVLGSRRRWWPTSEQRLARQLRKAGHEVIVTQTE